MRNQLLLLAALMLATACSDSNVGITNSPPEATISQPSVGAEVLEGIEVSFVGVVEDRGTRLEELEVSWSSSIDGALHDDLADSDGNTTFATANLTAGDHTITLQVRDDMGATGQATVDLLVRADAAPDIIIDAPTAEGVYHSNFPVALQATVNDAEDLPTQLRVSWAFDGGDTIVEDVTPDSSGFTTSSIDFEADTHSLIATVTDTGGNTRTATVSFVVALPNTAPTAPVVSISPSAPVALIDDLVCSIETASTDADNDTISYTFAWEVDTASWAGSTSTTSQPGDTIAASDLSPGEEWTCIVTPHDGTDSGTAGEDSVIIIGSACGDTLTDVDGNTYPTVEIGSQCWMGANLNTTHDANGVAISRWCCDCNLYGGMYDWSTAMNGSSSAGAQGVCPNGWHVPSDADWFVLEGHIDPSMTDPNYIGWSSNTIGDQLYSGGSYGFDWITGGFSYGGNACSHNTDRILYWSSSNYSSTDAVSRLFNTAFSGINRDMRGKVFGYYVRCLKD